MKKLSLFLFAALCTLPCAAQVTLKVDGFVSVADSTKSYIVVEVPTLDKDALFQKTKHYFTIIYNSPQSVISESGTDAISILSHGDVELSMGGIAGRASCNFSYKILCEFKNGRVKITPLWVDLVGKGRSWAIQVPSSLGGPGIYRKNGEIRDNKAKMQIENIVNPIVSGLELYLQKPNETPATEEW